MPAPNQIPSCPAAPPPIGPRLTTKDYLISLITPMFGGGVQAGENDPTMPIRATAIRGQLQFWWRATRGAACTTLPDLRERHRRVWGATECASPVIVEAVDVQPSAPVPCGVIQWQDRGGKGSWRLQWSHPFREFHDLPYALFPFQGTLPRNQPRATIEKHPAQCVLAASFTLRVRFPAALADDVEAAVWAWVNFGGLGARARRGCGAFLCRELAPASAGDVADWFRTRIGRLAPHVGAERPWSVLARSLLSRLEPGEPLVVWDWLIGIFKYFRQGEGFGRNPRTKPNCPGRSRFPEPDTIRRIMDTWLARHAPQDSMPDGFPRAEFGLPIVFHFKDDFQGDPKQTSLYPFVGKEKKDRMASPLILKPLALQDGSAVPLIVPLLAPQVHEVELWADGDDKGCRKPLHSVPVRSPAFAGYSNSPLDGLSSSGSALEAFLAFAQQSPHSFVEIAR